MTYLVQALIHGNWKTFHRSESEEESNDIWLELIKTAMDDGLRWRVRKVGKIKKVRKRKTHTSKDITIKETCNGTGL